MSHVSISKSYAILVGLEAYGNFRKGKKKTKRAARDAANKALPETMAHHDERKEQAIVDGNTTTDTTRRPAPDKDLQKKIDNEENKRDQNSFVVRMMQKCKYTWRKVRGLH